jgi:HK97 family phage major capsid protein
MHSLLTKIDQKSANRFFWSLIAILALMIAQSIGYTASADEIGLLGGALVGIGEVELPEIKSLLEQQARAFEEFKHKNDERLKAIETKGYAPADLTETVNKISEAMTKLDKEILEIQKKANRKNGGGDDDGKAEFKTALSAFARHDDRSGLIDLHKKAMNSSSDPEGGFLIIPELDSMIDRVVPTISTFAGLARNVTIGTQKYSKMTKTSGMTATWPGAGNTDGEATAPQYTKIDIEVFPVEVEPWIENETLEDAMVDLEMDLSDEAGIAFAQGIGSALITGNGVAKPRGLLSYTAIANASYAWGKVGYITSGKSAAFASVAPSDKIISLQHALKQQYRGNSTWMMNDATLGTVRQLKDGSGNYYLWNPDPAAGFGGSLLGRPVAVDDNMPDIAAGAHAIAYGDFQKAYTLVNRTGIKLIRDAITQKGVTKFNFRKRVGGGITNYEAVKTMKFATS